jgi:ketosteroid isomerase-like protein
MKALMLFFLATLLLSACGAPAGNNAPANNANTNSNANKAAANTATASAADTAAAEAEVKKLMDAAAAALAKNDADAMDKIYNDNYMLVNIDGSVQTKAERLAALRSGDAKYTAFSYSEPNIRVSPDGTAAIVIAKLSMKGVMRGKPTDGDYRVTQVYAKVKDGTWKQITAQATKIEGGSEPAKADDKKTDAPAANK